MILCENCVRLKTWMFVFAVYHSQTVHATLMGSLVQEGHAPHFSISGDHVVNVFSFSKASQIMHGESLWQASWDFHCKHEAFGMMGWRIGQVLARPAPSFSKSKPSSDMSCCTVSSRLPGLDLSVHKEMITGYYWIVG